MGTLRCVFQCHCHWQFEWQTDSRWTLVRFHSIRSWTMVWLFLNEHTHQSSPMIFSVFRSLSGDCSADLPEFPIVQCSVIGSSMSLARKGRYWWASLLWKMSAQLSFELGVAKETDTEVAEHSRFKFSDQSHKSSSLMTSSIKINDKINEIMYIYFIYFAFYCDFKQNWLYAMPV